MDQDEILSVLNDLVLTCKDGEQGFRKCADLASDPTLKALFLNRADSRATSADALQEYVRRHGGEPSTSSSISGTLHRRWIDLKTVLGGNDDEQILAECERGEEAALQSYCHALEAGLPEDIHAIVAQQHQGIEKTLEQIRALRSQATTQG